MSDLVLINDDLEVKKSEFLVKARYKLNPTALKLITTLIASVQKEDEPNKKYKISIIDFINMTDLKNTNKAYIYLKNACLDIMKKPIEFGKKGSKDFLIVNWVSSCKYIDKEGIIEFQISDEIFPYILALKERYLKYNIYNILHIQSEYSIRVYEWLKDDLNKKIRYDRTAEVEYDIDYIRDRLSIPDSYKWQNIKVRILDKAVKDLEKHTDIKFRWEIAKKRKTKVISVKFIIAYNKIDYLKNDVLPNYLKSFQNYVNYLRKAYIDKTFIALNYVVEEISTEKQAYIAQINNKGLLVLVPLYGGKGVITDNQTAELFYKTSYLCALHSKPYRNYIEKNVDLIDLIKDFERQDEWNMLVKEIVRVAKEHDPKEKILI